MATEPTLLVELIEIIRAVMKRITIGPGTCRSAISAFDRIPCSRRKVYAIGVIMPKGGDTDTSPANTSLPVTARSSETTSGANTRRPAS